MADVLPLAIGTLDYRMDSLKQWIVNMQLRAEGDTRDSERYRRLSDSFFQLMDDVTPGVRLSFSDIDRKSWQVMVKTDDGVVPLDLISQGMAAIFMWVGTLLERMYEIYADSQEPEQEPALVLIDEIGAHMHPEWQQALVPMLREKFPNLQVIATTHSPLIVANAGPEEVLLLHREDESGQIGLERMDSSFQGWRADQVLTGPAFQLETTLGYKTRRLQDEYAELLGKSRRSKAEEKRFQQLAGELEQAIPSHPESEERRLAFDLLDEWLQERVKDLPEERKKKIRKEVEKYFSHSRVRSKAKA